MMKRPLHMVKFLPPIDSRCVRDFVVFEKHIAGMKKSEGGDGKVPQAWYDQPVFITMNPHTLIGSGADLPMPPLTQALDFELEIAAIIGRKGSDLTSEGRDGRWSWPIKRQGLRQHSRALDRHT
jgi:2-keto-4-pentenoate hydratase/2-oxohepta-3-ene-1,7-dioic acid hydratase in catechol pathway